MGESIYDDIPYRPWGLEHRYGDHVFILAEPVLLTYLARLCAPETVQPKVNDLVEVCYRGLLERVFSTELPRVRVAQDTRMIAHSPQGRYCGQITDPTTRVVTVNIARAGTFPSHICFDLLNQLLDPSGVRQDHVIMDRLTDAKGRVVGAGIHGTKVGGSIDGCYLLFPDPMGATGSSLIRAIQHYKDSVDGTPRRIIAVHLIVTPEYLRAMRKAHPEVVVYAIRLDRGLSPSAVLGTVPGTHWEQEVGLNDHHYIVPGGGGFGEILNNSYV